MNNTTDEKDNTKTEQPKSKASRNTVKHRLISALLLICIAIAAATGYFALRSAKDEIKSNKNTYLVNSHEIVCATVASKTLQCENLESGELKRFKLPEKFHNAEFEVSPDGSRLLIATEQGGYIVTDSSFNEIKTLFEAAELTDRYPKVTWGYDSNHILISEIIYEENDLGSLPAPLVIKMLNLETGENKRVYKTGEMVPIDSIQVLGSTEDYLFIMMDGAKNWVAKSVMDPSRVINAIRLSDGFVRQVGSNQIDLDKDNQQITNGIYAWLDYSRGLFVFHGQRVRDVDANYSILAKLEEGEDGLQMQKVFEADRELATRGSDLTTSKGVVLYDDESRDLEYPVELVDDDNRRTKLQLTIDSSARLFTLPEMPEMTEASSVEPSMSEYVTADADTPQRVLAFLEKLVSCDDSGKRFASVVLENRVGDEQLVVLGGCENFGVDYYILRNDKYERVAGSSHGLDCDVRDKAGISPELVDCLEPGEGY